MADNRMEYRLELEAYTPDTLPQKTLAAFLRELSDLYGDEESVHFVRVDEGSVCIVSKVSEEAEASVIERVEGAREGSGPTEARKAFDAIAAFVDRSGAPGRLVSPAGATIHEFPSGQVVRRSGAFGPFWQPGHLRGVVILIGGKSDPVSVRLQTDAKVYPCRASREVAKRLRDYMWGDPIRVQGNGQWVREESGEWRLLKFEIDSFVPLDPEPLSSTVTRLRAIPGAWKERPDPLAELHDIRYGGKD